MVLLNMGLQKSLSPNPDHFTVKTSNIRYLVDNILTVYLSHFFSGSYGSQRLAGKMCLFFSYQLLRTTFPAWDWTKKTTKTAENVAEVVSKVTGFFGISKNQRTRVDQETLLKLWKTRRWLCKFSCSRHFMMCEIKTYPGAHMLICFC